MDGCWACFSSSNGSSVGCTTLFLEIQLWITKIYVFRLWIHSIMHWMNWPCSTYIESFSMMYSQKWLTTCQWLTFFYQTTISGSTQPLPHRWTRLGRLRRRLDTFTLHLLLIKCQSYRTAYQDWSWKVGFLKVYLKGRRRRRLKSLSDFCILNAAVLDG